MNDKDAWWYNNGSDCNEIRRNRQLINQKQNRDEGCGTEERKFSNIQVKETEVK
jgi:hypothetical protein